MIVEVEKDWILRAKTGWAASRLVGRLGRVVRWPVFFALNMSTPNRWEDLYKRAIARDILRSEFEHYRLNKSMQPDALKRRLIEALVDAYGAEEKRNQTILAAKEKNFTVAYWGKCVSTTPCRSQCHAVLFAADANLKKSA